MLSFPVLGTWIEIIKHAITREIHWSFPVLGTWIEISIMPGMVSLVIRRSLYWERGLKLYDPREEALAISRSLYWERGLKYFYVYTCHVLLCRSLYWERGLK